ncbi:MAG: type II secretion system protein M [Herminiimonas sp.]|nr:type II secretion system protein M [Herminiimonas sp.]
MRQNWQRLATRIDRLTSRERIISFASAALMVVTLVNMFLLDPLYASQKKLSNSIKQDQAAITALQQQIQQVVNARSVDKDAPAKARLKEVDDQTTALQASMRDMQKGLVSPDRMAALLESILKQNGRLKLMSLKTLPVANLNEGQVENKAGIAANAPATGAAKVDVQPAVRAIYKHGVEITLRGNYLDMMEYLSKLESMPWQLFWGRAQLASEDYPDNTLTLTLFTLSLDKAWLNL